MGAVPNSYLEAGWRMSDTIPLSSQAIAEVLEQVGRQTDRLDIHHGLKPAQWTALRFFAQVNNSQRTMSGFAIHHGVTPSTASQTIEALVRKGYLERRHSSEDRRVARLELLPPGRALLSDDPLLTLATVINDLPSEKRYVLAECLAVILDRLLKIRSRRDVPSANSDNDKVSEKDEKDDGDLEG
ncbi:hypothetical protein CCP2SC5_320037 [Azospirillaceae bacterium]